jgi:hypothetical protein
MVGAVAQLQKGVYLLGSLPDSASQQRHELDLLIALGRALMATRGYAAPEVGDIVGRARRLAERLDRPDYLVPLLYAQWSLHMTRAEYRLSLSMAAQMEQIGEARDDPAALLLGQRLRGHTHSIWGSSRPLAPY